MGAEPASRRSRAGSGHRADPGGHFRKCPRTDSVDLPLTGSKWQRRPSGCERISWWPRCRWRPVPGSLSRNLEVQMATPVPVSRFESKSHDSPDETRSPAKTRIEIVRLEGYTLGRFNFEPGESLSECVKPVAGTNSSHKSHIGYA